MCLQICSNKSPLAVPRKVSLSPESEEDISAAGNYYATLDDDLSAAFFKEVSVFLQKVQDHPDHFSPLRGEVRRASLKRFPYYIVFETVDNVTEVLRVLHNRQQRPKVFTRVEEAG